ncbi:MAG: PSD1 and planctomycete cytochrome C domain-containing protein [Chthoniobacteraceae bacterium]
MMTPPAISVTALLAAVAAISAFSPFARASELDTASLPPPSSKLVVYESDIRPILEEHCIDCHGAEKQKGGLRLDRKAPAMQGGDSFAPAIVPNKSEESPLIHFVAGLDPDLKMPPKGKRLTPEEIGILRAWIDAGADWPDDGFTEDKVQHWAFLPVTRPAIPAGADPIDHLIAAKLAEAQLTPASPADRHTLIRRLYFDLIGLPPSPDEVASFVSDKRPEAYPELVNRLLASPRYGERWARHWLDVVRFAETNGFETNTPRPNAWPYRDYVIRAFNEDKPFNRFIVEQLAGDAVGVNEATGFIVGGAWDEVKSPDKVLTANQRADELHDMVSTTSSAFLGLTVGCARCHNHKFDPIPQVAYFAMKACFAGVQHGERPLETGNQEERATKQAELLRQLDKLDTEFAAFEPIAETSAQPQPSRRAVDPRRNVERFSPTLATRLRFTVSQTTSAEPCIDELEVFTSDGLTNVALASAGAKATASSVYPNSEIHRLEHLNDGQYGNGRSWISNERGKGWVELEFAKPVEISRVMWARDRESKFTDRLATEYRIEVADPSGQWKVVATSADRLAYQPGAPADPYAAPSTLAGSDRARYENLAKQRRELSVQLTALARSAMVYAGRITEPEPTFRFHRGDPMHLREEVSPGGLPIMELPFELERPQSSADRRLALGRWIASPQNPLTARVIANRIWQFHFGEGLVSTSSDFGINGAKPSHPELLDWLASELVEHGWSLKHLHRAILNSATYRQSSDASEAGLRVDASTRLLWRFPPRRLEAEPIRDAILSVSGKLDLTAGGPGFSTFKANDNYVRVYEPLTDFGPAQFRRMIYMTKVRMQQDSTFGAFDCPDGGQIAPRRTRSTTPLQALNLLNSSFLLQQAGFFAERLAAEAEGDQRRQIQRAFQLAFSRDAAPEEATAAQALISEHGLPAFCRAIFNANEFVYVY